MKRVIYWSGLLFLLGSACDCSKDGGQDANHLAALPKTALRAPGKLRILTPRRFSAERLPRGDFPLDHEAGLVKDFCRLIGLEPEFVYASGHDRLIPRLLEGQGDLIMASLTVTNRRRKQVAFSVPLEMIREQLVTRTNDSGLEKPEQLSGRRVAVRPSSAYRETLDELRSRVKGMRIEDVDESLDTEQILSRVADGSLDTTVADSNLIEAARRYLPNLKVAFDLSDERPVAWAVRPDNPLLLRQLNSFLAKSPRIGRREQIYKEDLPGLQKKGVLRVLTRNSATTYFLHRGELVGFEYELAREFARHHDLVLEIIVPPAREDLIPWLLAGRGDLVAAGLTVTAERKKHSGAAFSRPYQFAVETVVGSADEKPMVEVEALAGRTLVVRRKSPYWDSLEKLKAQGHHFTLQAAPAELETEEIIARVADGSYDLTVADSHILEIELTYRNDVRGLLTLGTKSAHGWAVQADNKKLLSAIDTFFDKEYRGLYYNLSRNKYFKNRRGMRARAKHRPTRTGRLSPYDPLVKKYAEKYRFDWRLITSQMYAESRFDPQAKSWVGARGLMQVMPRTAKQMGLTRLADPETGIHAGVKYLDWIRDQLPEQDNFHTQNWFTLAAYNAGLGHLKDARELARRQGLDPDRWFGNVERAMLLLSKPKFAKQARYGFCRGSEPVSYVRSIRERWRAYKRARPIHKK